VPWAVAGGAARGDLLACLAWPCASPGANRILRHMATVTSPSMQALRSPTKSSHVQYGCGWSAPKEWTNFDASLTLKWERLTILGRYTKNSQRFPANVRPGDIVKGLPIPDESCQGVYASHVLEHLALEDFHKALQNTYRILRKAGVFRLVVPDLERSAREYITRLDGGEPNANAYFLRETTLGCVNRDRGLIGLAKKLFNTSAHLWMWDETSMTKALQDHGFRQIRRCRFGDCEDTMFSLVEERGRFENAVAMEARR
jgi:SAM-dependent methyltransferase